MIDGLRYIAQSPAQEHGGFHPDAVAVAREALDALSFRRFEHVLRAHGLVDPCALDDPEGYDNYRTHGAIHAAHRELVSQNASDEPRPLGAVGSGRLFEEPAGKTPANSNSQ